MKKFFLTLILITMFFSSWSQNYVYDSNGDKEHFKAEDIDVTFTNSGIKFQESGGSELYPALLAVLPTVIDAGFQLTTSALEKRVKKFSSEYSKHKSNLYAGSREIPNFTFTRSIKLDDSSDIKALEISFKAKQVDSIQGFIYYIDNIELKYSAAKSTSSKNTFDYSIELNTTFLIDGEKKVQEISPITISSVGFQNNQFNPEKHRSDIIPLTPGAVITEVSIKIVETNPAKVRAEKILSIWNENKDSTKTIVNNFLPEAEDESDDESEPVDENSGTGNDEGQDDAIDSGN